MGEKVKIGDICTIVTGSTPKTNIPEYWDGDIDWITPAELNEDSYFIEESNRKITKLAVCKTGLTSFPKGTVILSSRAPIGKVAIANKEMYCNQGFKNLICGPKIYNEYLYWYLKSNTEYLNSLGRGATFKEISKKIVESIEIDLPSLTEQKKIVCKLKKCHGIIQHRRKELQILDELVKARFVEMFGDPIKNDKGWKTKCITDICSTIKGGGTPSKNNPLYFQGDIPWISPKDMKSELIYDSQDHITKEAIENSTTSIIPANSVLMVIRSGILKHDLPVAINKVPLTINQDIKAFILGKEIISIFLLYYFKTIKSEILSGVRAVTADNIDFKDFQKRMVILPSLSLQKQFADFADQAEKSKSVIQKSLDETQILFQSLMQKYFG